MLLKTALQNLGKFQQTKRERGTESKQGRAKVWSKVKTDGQGRQLVLHHRPGIKRIILKTGEDDKEHVTMLRGGKREKKAAEWYLERQHK